MTVVATQTASSIPQRVAILDWTRIRADLDSRGMALTGPLLNPNECRSLGDAYSDDTLYRKRVIMGRHGFGSGEYKYYEYPLPPAVAALREAMYPRLACVANEWTSTLGTTAFPPTLARMVEYCRARGQARPTPLILRYSAGDYNCLHQDVYGEAVFPIQLTVLLSDPQREFEGGEFVLVEQRPRKQSRVEVVSLARGEGVLFAVRNRPVRGSRGTYKASVRHGVATVRSGERIALGIIFHEAAC